MAVVLALAASRSGPPLPLPQMLCAVRCGFPSPAEDWLDADLDLNEHLIANRPATFIVRVDGDSMRDAGIRSGDLLVVDRSITPRPGHVVIAVVDGDLTCKRLVARDDGTVVLRAENPAYPDIAAAGCDACQLWGVVRHVIHSFRLA